MAFGVSAAAIALLGFRGGTYDLVARQEAAIAIWWILALGFGLGLLPRSRIAGPALLPLAILVGLGAWTALGLGWTESDERTLAEVSRIVGYLGLLVLVLAVLDRDSWRAGAAGLAAGALLIAGVAVASRLAPDLFPDDPVKAFRRDRLTYPFDYWNAVGAWSAMAATAGLAWSVTAKRTAQRAAFLAAMPTAALAMYLSYSRACLAGVAIGSLCILALSRRRLLAAVHLAVAVVAAAVVIVAVRSQPSLARGVDDSGAAIVLLALLACSAACAGAAILCGRAGVEDRRPGRGRGARLAVVGLAAALLAVAAVLGPGLADRAWTSFRDSDEPALTVDPSEHLGSLSGSGRYDFWSVALDTYRADPLHGAGAGTFEFAWNRAGRAPEFIRDAHSAYLEPLAETGWPGALLTLAFFGAVALVSLQALRRPGTPDSHGAGVAVVATLAVFLLQAGVDWLWETTAVTALALAGPAMLWCRLGSEGRRARLAAPARVGATVACLGMCLLLVPGAVSTSLVRRSQQAMTQGDLRDAAAKADDAVASAPWAATPRLQRGLVAEAAGDLPAARASIREAVEREPENWRHPLALARVEAESGDPGAAVRQLRRARALRPQAAVFRLTR